MRFIDEAKIRITGGHGGPGCVSFRRETFVPRGGPDGGDGGAGADVIFIASTQLSTLQDFRFKRAYQAPNGMHGSGANKSGRAGVDIVIRVPVGTTIKDTNTGELLVDFTEDGQKWLACKGGRGGKGNAHFVTSTFQAPKFAQPGEEGEHKEITLELKLLADTGIIGYPNAGKSTLISRMSAAKPKIADYPFTTLTPHLGVVQVDDEASFVIADIPGLVEGAHKGEGLGHRFLKHIERTQVFVHLLDGTVLLEGETLAEQVAQLVARYQVIRTELGLFNEGLLHKPEIIVINKIDALPLETEELAVIQKAFRDEIATLRGNHPQPGEPFLISGVSGQGIQELIHIVMETLRAQKGGSEKDAKNASLPDDERLRN